MAEVAPAIEIAGGSRFSVSIPTRDALQIGGMWFHEPPTPFFETCHAIFEEGAEPQRVRDILDLFFEKMRIGFCASQSDTHGFAQAAFLPRQAEPLLALGQLLAAGRGRLRCSRIALTEDVQCPLGDNLEALKVTKLSEDQRKLLRFLGYRRGLVGEPLKAFWKIACHLGLAQEAMEIRRDYGSGFIPKLKVDGHLFQIERAPLLEQVSHAIQADCSGLVWLTEEYPHEEGYLLELQALTFDNPSAVREHLLEQERRSMRAVHEALSRVWEKREKR